jgi:hypothetical protein
MDEKRGCPGARQCGGDLAGDMTGFTHPQDHDPAPAIEYKLAGSLKCLIDTGDETGHGCGFGVDDGPGQLFQGETVHMVILTRIDYWQLNGIGMHEEI